MHEILSYGVYFKSQHPSKKRLEEIDQELKEMIRMIENAD